MRLRITLRGHELAGDRMLLAFAVDDDRGEMAASVLVDRHGNAHFPHELSDLGEPISPVVDAALRERAAQTVAMLEAATAWGTIRARPRRRDRT